MTIIAQDRNGFNHEVTGLVICIDQDSVSWLNTGTVYAVVGQNGSDLFILDDRNVKQNYRKDRFQTWHRNVWLNDTEGAVGVRALTDYKTITDGYYYPMTLRRTGKKSNEGCFFVKDNKGIWGMFSKRAFQREPLQYSAAALVYRAQVATGRTVQAEAQTSGPVVGEPPVAGTALNFNPDSVTMPRTLDTDVVNVKVQFTTGDTKHYSYKHIGKVNVGDYAVVIVNNDRYPELCGIKVVEVMDVLPMTVACQATKWLVTVFDMQQYNQRTEAEKRFREAKAELDRKVEEAKRLSVYTLLAKENPEVAHALAGLQELAKVIGTTL